MSLRTLPARQSSPTSGPPYATSVRSLTFVRRIARIKAIGLRREPQPPTPIVMPSWMRAATAAAVIRLSVMVLLAGLGRPRGRDHSGVAASARHGGQRYIIAKF